MRRCFLDENKTDYIHQPDEEGNRSNHEFETRFAPIYEGVNTNLKHEFHE